MKPKDRLSELIAEGEHQQQDFKYEISSVSKIAHSISAFANTEGGRLLVGVRDNGTIAGVRSDEEIYMIDAAAHTGCSPEVDCTWETVKAEGHTVLIATIPASDHRPVMAHEEGGRWRAYVRIADENIVATPVHLALWRSEQVADGTLMRFTEQQTTALDLLAKEGEAGLTLNQFCRRVMFSRKSAIRLLADLVRFALVKMEYRGQQFRFVTTGEEITGVVVRGHQLGRRLGYPTANVAAIAGQENTLPRRGVYAAIATLSDARRFPAMVNIGYRPTVENEHHLTIEAHLVGFSGDLYGQRISLRFIDRIRDERKMESLEDLKAQLARDLQAVKACPQLKPLIAK
ncbi:MAG: putative DNA binding domain-containing protein [Bacteroidales bacterium]|nr:putative DNA binding domain-containing protein [Bacteroidales bacterium]